MSDGGPITNAISCSRGIGFGQLRLRAGGLYEREALSVASSLGSSDDLGAGFFDGLGRTAKPSASLPAGRLIPEGLLLRLPKYLLVEAGAGESSLPRYLLLLGAGRLSGRLDIGALVELRRGSSSGLKVGRRDKSLNGFSAFSVSLLGPPVGKRSRECLLGASSTLVIVASSFLELDAATDDVPRELLGISSTSMTVVGYFLSLGEALVGAVDPFGCLFGLRSTPEGLLEPGMAVGRGPRVALPYILMILPGSLSETNSLLELGSIVDFVLVDLSAFESISAASTIDLLDLDSASALAASASFNFRA